MGTQVIGLAAARWALRMAIAQALKKENVATILEHLGAYAQGTATHLDDKLVALLGPVAARTLPQLKVDMPAAVVEEIIFAALSEAVAATPTIADDVALAAVRAGASVARAKGTR